MGVVQALMHDPDLLVLDEPTSGLDPLAQREVLALVRARRDAGAGVLFSSHVLPEVEDVADRVGILRRGRLVHEASVASLRDVGRQRIELRMPGPVAEQELAALPGLAGHEVREVAGGATTVLAEVGGEVGPLLRWAADHGVQRVTSHEQDVEDVFFEYYREQP